jgi:tetratricopeptide (TPR) repeat protein
VHRTILVVDVANFGDRQRTIPEQVTVRDGVYRALQEGLSAVGVTWTSCDHEDRGDGLFLLIPPEVPKTYLVDRLPRALVTALSNHNGTHSARERIQLRMAVHAGEVSYDDHGVTGPSLNLAFRLVDAPELKSALTESSGVLAVIVSPWFFDEVVRHSPASQPASYRSIRVRIKETDTVAWITLPDNNNAAETLVGRDAELSRLGELVRGVVAGNGSAVLVDGEPGIGKSALVRAACADARGCLILWGVGDELGQALPLLPVLDALRMLDPSNNPRGEAISRLLRGEVPLGGADPVAAASEQVVATIGELCTAGPVVLVIDDLQWADRATVTVWSRLSRSIHRLRLLLIGITRPVPRSAELSALLRAATGHVRLTLKPLPKSAVIDLVATAAGGPPDANLIRLAEGAAGNPLFLTELIEALRRDNALRITNAGTAELVGTGVPESLPAAIQKRLEFAEGWVGEVLRAAALLGVEFSVQELAAILIRQLSDLRWALDEARAAGVLRNTGEHLAFRHPLIREVLYEGMPAGVRAAWHLDAARALAKSAAPISRVARQLLCAIRQSGTQSFDDSLTTWLVTAAPSLVAQSPPLAVELLRTAISTSTSHTDLLTCRLAEALFRTGDIPEAERLADHTATTVTDPDLMVDLQWTLTQCRAMTGRFSESLAALERTLTAPGIDSRHRARLLVLAAGAQRDLGKVGAAVRFADQALAEAEIIDDRWTIAWALHVLIIASVMRGEVGLALPLFDRALAVTKGDATLVDLRMLVQINHATALGDLDQYDNAIATAWEVCRLAERMGSLVRLAQAHCALGELLFDVGRWDDALAQVSALNDEVKGPAVTCCDHGIAAVIDFHRERPRQARRRLELAAPCAQRIGDRVIGSLALARSLEHECSGAYDQALAALTACLTAQAEEFEEMEDLLPDAVRLAVHIGDRPTANKLAGQAEKLKNSTVPHRSGVAYYCQGLLDRDPDRLLHAAERYGESGRPLPRAKALEAAAIAIVEGRTAGDAHAAFTAADDLYTALGAKWDTNRLRTIFRRYCG